MLHPWMGNELARDRMAAFRAEAVRDGRVRRPRAARRSRTARADAPALGMRLVRAGNRLLGGAGEVR